MLGRRKDFGRMSHPPSGTIGKMWMMMVLTGLNVLLAVAAIAHPQEQPDWKQWTTKDVNQVLSKSPWVSSCCWEFRNPAQQPPVVGGGIRATIVSSEAVRRAFVRRIQLDKHYGRLDAALQQDVDKRIGTCLNTKFDGYLVLSLSYDFSGVLDSALTSSDQIHLLTSDGTKIAGHLVADPITPKCALLPTAIKWFDGAPPRNEIAFPRYVDGKPTIRQTDTTIRIVIDFHETTGSVRRVGELDFDIDKLIHQGNPDF
jgi:hypothetical protein